MKSWGMSKVITTHPEWDINVETDIMAIHPMYFETIFSKTEISVAIQLVL